MATSQFLPFAGVSHIPSKPDPVIGPVIRTPLIVPDTALSLMWTSLTPSGLPPNVPITSSPVWPNSVAVIGGCVGTGDGRGVDGGVIGFEGGAGVVAGAGIGAGAVGGDTGVGVGGVGAGVGFAGAVGVGLGAGDTTAGVLTAGGGVTTGAGAATGEDGAAAGGAGAGAGAGEGQENRRARRKPQVLGFVVFCPSAAKRAPGRLKANVTAHIANIKDFFMNGSPLQPSGNYCLSSAYLSPVLRARLQLSCDPNVRIIANSSLLHVFF